MSQLGRIVRVIELFRTSRMVALRMAGAIAAFSLWLLRCTAAGASGIGDDSRRPRRLLASRRRATQPAPQLRERSAAGAAPAQDLEAPTIKVQANEVDLVFTVTDKKGHFVTGLNQSSFGLLDNGRPPERCCTSTSRPTCRCASASCWTPAVPSGSGSSSSRIRRLRFCCRCCTATTARSWKASTSKPTWRRDSPTTSICWTRASTSCVRAAARRCSTRSTRPARTRC